MDIMGPLPTTKTGFSYILTIQDLLTKYSLAIPLKQASAIDVADAFAKEFICIYGAPRAWLTDQGTHFLNALMRNIAKKFRITRYQTTAYRPQSNGSIERSHHVLWEYLKQFCERSDWDEYLRFATFSYNTSVHEGTQYTPHELIFGKTARAPSSDPPIENEPNETYFSYLENLFEKLRDTQDNARENLKRAKERSKKYYDRRMNAYTFKVGNHAYLLKEPSKGKLDDQYTGPYEIIEVLGNNNVKLQIGNRTRIVHIDKLKPARR
jgi:transposase InsO family protein